MADEPEGVVLVPRASAVRSIYVGNSVYADFLGDRFKLYVSDGRFAGPPIFLSAEDLGVLFNYSVSCLEAVRGANDE